MTEVRFGAGSKALLVLAASIIVAAGLKWGEPLLVPLLVAACIAAATSPLVRGIARLGVPTYLAVTLTIVIVLAGLVGFGALTAMAASDLSETLPKLETALVGSKVELSTWLAEHSMGRFSPLVAGFDPGKLTDRLLASAVLGLPDAVSSFGVVLFVVIFILLESASFPEKLHTALHWKNDRVLDIKRTVTEVQKYLLVKTWISAAMGALCGIWCAVMGLNQPVLWGITTFLLNFIPVFGPFIATIAPALAAVLELGLGGGLIVIGGLLVVHNVLANLVEPKVMGRACGLSPLVVMLSIVFWGFLLGPVGALLSVPLTMVVKIILSNTEDLRWASVLLGAGSGKAEASYLEQRVSRPLVDPNGGRSQPA